MKKILIAGVVILALVALFFVFNSFIYNEKQADDIDSDFEPYRATLTGTYVCLANTEGEPEEECKGGIETDSGEYYAIDFALMSQTHTPFAEGDTLTASGVIVPIERLSTDVRRQYAVEGIFSVTSIDSRSDDGPYACDGDGKICPDGSLVGREGPSCDFAACPSPNATSSVVTTYIGGTATGLKVSVMPKEIVSDSRCPTGVQCIWEGTVEVLTTLSTVVSHGEHVMKLNEPQRFDPYIVTLIEVAPQKTEDSIPLSSYRVTYEIVKN